MSNKIANQLLVRVQNEMAHNITAVKKQLIEWLERPESGGIDVLAEQLSEVSGGLTLLARNNAARLCTVLANSVKTLDAKFHDKEIETAEFNEIGAEIASGLILLNDYIERLSLVEPSDERVLNEAAQTIEGVLAGNSELKIAVQPKIDREVYQALSAKVTEVLETSRNQIEQYGVHANKQFDAAVLIGHNKNLISLFEVLNLQAPQLLLKQINQMLGEQLSESQWIDIAEAMILVEETLKYAQLEGEHIADYGSAINEQSGLSRGLEIQKLLRDTGNVARQFYENLRKNVTSLEAVSAEQSWKESALRTSHFASIAQLVEEKQLANVLKQLALQFAEISLQSSHKAEAYPAVVDVLVAVEYIFSDLSDTAKINLSDVAYLKQVSDVLATFYPASAQAKSLLIESIHQEADIEDSKQDSANLGGDLDDVLDSLDALDTHFDGVVSDDEDEQAENEEDLPKAVAVVGQGADDGNTSAAGSYQAYFAGKSLDDLSALHVPSEKENFLASHDAAVMDEEIREFFLEELVEKIQEIQQELTPWREKPFDNEHIGTVRRAFHTIKGSGRTVGYEALGECAWQHEQMLNRVIDKTFSVNPTLQTVISDTVELLRILTTGGGFIEQHAALLTQASLAEHLTQYLTEHPEADEQIIAQYANSVRAALTDESDIKHVSQTIEKITETLKGVHTQSAMPNVADFGHSLDTADSNAEANVENFVESIASAPTVAASEATVAPTSSQQPMDKDERVVSTVAVAENVEAVSVQNKEAVLADSSRDNAADTSSDVLEDHGALHVDFSAPSNATTTDDAESDSAHSLESDDLFAVNFETTVAEEAAPTVEESNIVDEEDKAFSLDFDVNPSEEESAAQTVSAHAHTTATADLSEEDAAFALDFDVSPSEEESAAQTVSAHAHATATAELSEEDAAFALDFDVSPSEEESAAQTVFAHAHTTATAKLSEEDAAFALDFDVGPSEKESAEQTVSAQAHVHETIAQDAAAKVNLQSLASADLSADEIGKDIFDDVLSDIAHSAVQAQAQANASAARVEHSVPENAYVFGQAFYANKSLADLDNLPLVAGHAVSDEETQSVDQDIVDIFLEELDVTIEQIAQILPQWKSSLHDKKYAEEVRRAFHTVKGSGKMVGYQSLGEFAWQYEHLLNAIAENYFQANDLVLNIVGDANDLLKLLRTDEGFSEHKPSLSHQGQVAAQVREQLIANPDMSHVEQSQMANALYAQAQTSLSPTSEQTAAIQAESYAVSSDDKLLAPSQASSDAPMVNQQPAPLAGQDVDLASLAKEVSSLIGNGLRSIDINDEDDKSLLRDMVSARIARQENTLSPEQMAALTAQVSAQLAGQVSAGHLTQVLPQAAAFNGQAQSVSPAVATTAAVPFGATAAESAAYRHMADMLQRSLAAQPLDADDEAILARQITQEIQRVGQSLETEDDKAALQAHLSAAFSGSSADSAAYDHLLSNVLAKIGGNMSAKAEAAANIDDATMQRLVATVARMSSMQTDSDDAEILRHQIQAAIANHAQDAAQQEAIQLAIAASLRENFAQQAQATALLDEVFAQDTVAQPEDALDQVYQDAEIYETEEAFAVSAALSESAALEQQVETPMQESMALADTKEVLTAAASAEYTFDDNLSDAEAVEVTALAEIEENAASADVPAEETAQTLSVSVEQAVSSSDDNFAGLEATEESVIVETAEEAALSAVAVEETVDNIEHVAEETISADEQAIADALLKEKMHQLANEASVSESSSIDGVSKAASVNVNHVEAVQTAEQTLSEENAADESINDADDKNAALAKHAPSRQQPSLSSANAPKQSISSLNRLSDELSKISAHPSLDDAPKAPQASYNESLGLSKFLRAIDNFESSSQQVEENNTPEMLDNLIESVYDIEDSLAADSVPDWIWRMLDAIEQLLLTYRSQGASISLNAASILRQSINLIENFEEDSSAEEANQTINSLIQTRKELGSNVVAPLSRKAEPIAVSAPIVQNWDEWIPDPNAGTELAETFLDEAVLLLGRSQVEAECWEKNRSSIMHLDVIRRDMHTLKGGARMSGYLALGDLMHAVESMIESIVDGHSEANYQAVSILNGALWQAMIMLDSVRDGFLPQTDPYILNNINRFLNLPLPYPEVAEQENRLKEAAIVEKPAVDEVAVSAPIESETVAEEEVAESAEETTAFDENIDPILVDIFTDEAQELIDQAELLFSQDLKNTEVIEELKRNMHTLKGAARLVGLTAIGDTSHLMESVIEQLSDYNETKMRQAKTLLNLGHEALYTMLDSVLRKEMPTPAHSLNDSLTIFAKEGRFVQPSVAVPKKAPEEPVVLKEAQETVKETVAEVPVQSSHAKETKKAAIAATDTAEAHVAEAEVSPQISSPQAEPESAAQTEKQAEKSEAPEVPKAETPHAEVQRYVRVDAGLLDEMIAMVGETAIMRSRLESVSSESAFNLNELTRIANRIDEQMRRLDNETEAQMLFRREAQATDDEHFDPLEMDRFSEIQQLSRQLSEAINDLKNVQEALAQENALIRNISIQQGFIQRGIQDRLLTTQLVRFDVNEARLKRLVRQTAKSVDKDIELIIEGGHVELERRLIEDVLPAIEHMIRNSVGHGIETAAERAAAGKPAQGIIKLSIAAKSSNVEIRILDDGRGFDYDRIREKARSKGWLDENKAHDYQYLNGLLMRSGFSTAQAVTQLSGRGVGMDVVSEMVKQRRGQLIAESIPGKGAQFTILMPFTMSISEVLLVEVAEQTYAVPMNMIAAISQVPREELQNSHNGEETYTQYDGMDYRVCILGDYFKPEEYQFAVEAATAPALFINASGEPTAFYVDRVANRVEVIVKNVNRQVLNIPGISGATILGDGNVVPVLEPLDLARRINTLSQYHTTQTVEEVFVPNVLVVDDSVTMRKVSTRLLERNGYIVESAKDGLDAIDVLQRFTPDLILLDIEMPRMDGFEFASHVRQNSHVSQVPIIMITSRTGDKHRERADQIGVQGYLGKPYREDVLIETIESLLGDKANG